MKKTKILFFMDTEDFTDERSLDAARDIADLLTEEGVTGHFVVVGLVAKMIRDLGRTDVLTALGRHLIGTHSFRHTMHPTLVEDTDLFDFDEAYEAIAPREAEGLRLIREVFGVTPLFASCPGTDNSYVAQYFYADNGIRFYGENMEYRKDRNMVYACNMMQCPYLANVEDTAFTPEEEPVFDLDGAIDALLDMLAAKEWSVFSTHPNKALFKNFWDAVNFNKRNQHPDGNYAPCDSRSPEEVAHYYAAFRRMIRRVKADDRFEITTVPAVLAAEKPRVPLTRGDIPAILRHLSGACAPMEAPSLSLADLFGAAVAFAGGAETFTPGLSYGLLEESFDISSPVVLEARDVLACARELADRRFWPAEYKVGGVRLGFLDMLYAMYHALAGEERFTLAPHPACRLLEEAPEFQSDSFYAGWLHSDELKDEFLTRRLRLQLYTVRPIETL